MEDNIGISVGIYHRRNDGRLALSQQPQLCRGKAPRRFLEPRSRITLGEVYWEETLIEPICQTVEPNTTRLEMIKTWALFANPASVTREQLRVKVTRDEYQTWNQGRLIHAGPAAYSDLS